jgi:hypothetical protein
VDSTIFAVLELLEDTTLCYAAMVSFNRGDSAEKQKQKQKFSQNKFLQDNVFTVDYILVQFDDCCGFSFW